MAAYEYKALDAKGREKKGVLEADSARQVRASLREQGLVPLEVAVATAVKQAGKSGGFSFARKISAADLALITRQLATLVSAAMPLEECLKAVAQQCENPRIQSMIVAVRSKVVEGYSLADSMREYPTVFDDLFCAMVAAGEKSGHLGKVLDRLADYTEQRDQMNGKLKQAMVYPVMLTFVAISVIIFLLTSVVPKVVSQFDHLGGKLPQTTQLLITISEFLQNYWMLMVGIIIGAIVAFRWYVAKPTRRKKYHRLILNLPVIGKVSKGVNTARFARTLAILNSSAVPLLEAMQIAGDVLSNLHMKEQVLAASDRVREGASLGASLEQTKLFPPMMLHMIISGERSGELESMLSRSADNQDRLFESQVAIALSVFQPLLIMFMAGMVLFIVISILQPILQLNTMIGR